MNIKTHHQQETTIFTLSGKFEFHAQSELLSFIDNSVQSGAQTIILDLQHVPFIDSLAIGFLVTAYKKLKRQAIQLQLVCPENNTVVKGILNNLKIPDLIPTLPSLHEPLPGTFIL